ncbi:hypothetical protein B0T11DRAFT_345267, partial [Plectosphaerella cucumerina]
CISRRQRLLAQPGEPTLLLLLSASAGILTCSFLPKSRVRIQNRLQPVADLELRPVGKRLGIVQKHAHLLLHVVGAAGRQGLVVSEALEDLARHGMGHPVLVVVEADLLRVVGVLLGGLALLVGEGGVLGQVAVNIGGDDAHLNEEGGLEERGAGGGWEAGGCWSEAGDEADGEDDDFPGVQERGCRRHAVWQGCGL